MMSDIEATAKDLEEDELECLVFGKRSSRTPGSKDGEGFSISEDNDEIDKKFDYKAADVFTIDRSGDKDCVGDTIDAPITTGEVRTDADEDANGHKPAWHDEDDSALTVAEAAATLTGQAGYCPASAVPVSASYHTALQHRFTAIHGRPDWAQLPDARDATRKRTRRRRGGGDSSDESCDEAEQRVLASTGQLLAAPAGSVATGGPLPSGELAFKRCRDLIRSVPSVRYPVSGVEFHPRAPVAVVSGGGKTVSIVQVDGADNPLIQQVSLNRSVGRLWSHFSADGCRLLCGSELSPAVFCYDMMAGRGEWISLRRRLQIRGVPQLAVSPDSRWVALTAARAGAVHLLDPRSCHVTASLQLGDQPTSIAFSNGGERLWTHTRSGHVYEWDVASRACVHRFVDDGCLAGTCLAVSPDGALMACGSSSGVVNVYASGEARRSAAPQPLTIYSQLTTACTRLVFDSSSQLLAMCSSGKDSGVRLAHLQSGTVFSNFPGWNSVIKRPLSLDLSLNSGYLAVGCNNARVPLFRLKHFSSF